MLVTNQNLKRVKRFKGLTLETPYIKILESLPRINNALHSNGVLFFDKAPLDLCCPDYPIQRSIASSSPAMVQIILREPAVKWPKKTFPKEAIFT